jgi:hypothetical protein
VTREDAARSVGIGGEAVGQTPPPQLVLSQQEKSVLDFLVACKDGKTAAQIGAGAHMDREEVAAALDSLRKRGLVTRFNTLVESYAARFPGVEV